MDVDNVLAGVMRALLRSKHSELQLLPAGRDRWSPHNELVITYGNVVVDAETLALLRRIADAPAWPPPDPHHTLPRLAVEAERHTAGGDRPPVYLFPHIGCAVGDCLPGARLINVGNPIWRPNP